MNGVIIDYIVTNFQIQKKQPFGCCGPGRGGLCFLHYPAPPGILCSEVGRSPPETDVRDAPFGRAGVVFQQSCRYDLRVPRIDAALGTLTASAAIGCGR